MSSFLRRLAMRGRLLAGGLFMLVACCAIGDEAPGVSYTRQVQPILERRCVVCHACYDAPCQLKLGSIEGVLRGASKDKVYDGTRLKEATPSRLFVDAMQTSQWRSKGFTPVLGEEGNMSNATGSVLRRMLDLKQRNALPAGPVLPTTFDFALDRKQSCPAPKEMDQFEREHPGWGMPYGLPGLDASETTTINQWLQQGAPDDTVHTLAPEDQRQVARWESFLNGRSNKKQLVSRYLFEHLFQAHLHFGAGAHRPYFRLVRSYTPPGQPVHPLTSRRPTDDPQSTQFYYRLELERETIVDKTHIPFALTPERMARWRAWFLDDPYPVTTLPGYAPDVANNPFVVFQAIPAATRYRFLLDEAEYFVMGFIKGPVCRGQVALNVIEDHFWVFFYNDAMDAGGEGVDELLRQQAHNLSLPAEQSSRSGFMGPWMRYALREHDYLQAKATYMTHKVSQGRQINLDLIWNGDGHNPNAALTVFRHFDNASVVKGLVGEPPKTAWVLSYPLLERIHYLLVAGFDVYGNVGHQLLSRLYMDLLRMEGEVNFLTLLPRTERDKLHQYWYRGATAQARIFLRSTQSQDLPDTHIRYHTAQPQHELYSLLKSHLAPVLDTRHDLNTVADAALRHDLQRLASVKGRNLEWLPELSYLQVDEAGSAPRYFTLLRNTGHRNVSQLLSEKLALIPVENSLTVANGFIGSYPNALYRVGRKQIEAFANGLSRLGSEKDYQAFAGRFAVRRTDPRFWAFSDALQDTHLRQAPVEAGLLDYNRLENR